jgi:hypothetical protein
VLGVAALLIAGSARPPRAKLSAGLLVSPDVTHAVIISQATSGRSPSTRLAPIRAARAGGTSPRLRSRTAPFRGSTLVGLALLARTPAESP